MPDESYFRMLWIQFRKHSLGIIGLIIVVLFCLIGIYAPFLASSKPFVVKYEGSWYFPLFRYLFYPGFYTKWLDIFFNIQIFALPIFLIALLSIRPGLFKKFFLTTLFLLDLFVFMILLAFPPGDPGSDPVLNDEKQKMLQEYYRDPKGVDPSLSWKFHLHYMSPYEKLNLLLEYQKLKNQHERLISYDIPLEAVPTLWQIKKNHLEDQITQQRNLMKNLDKTGLDFQAAEAKLKFLMDREHWLEEESAKLKWEVMPLIRTFHWEEDAGGDPTLNQHLPWWELTRTNRKDLVAALIFGVRVSLVVGFLAIFLAAMIGIPIGCLAGYYGGTFDIIVCRLLEIWESMPIFFMLLMVVGVLQSKSIFLVIAVIGFFGWTGFSRYIRGEFFKQRNLSYVEACQALGFRDPYIIFVHILPNSIPPILTLLPFAIMGAITSEAGLSFLGLGEEGSASWGVLMDEGRKAFPGESYLLWPPAILLTILLVAIALVGDSLRDVLDPKLR